MGEGTFSEVLKCQSMLDGKLYACKKMKQRYRRYTHTHPYSSLVTTCHQLRCKLIFGLCICSSDQVNNLREVQALRRLNPHPNVIELKEVVL